MPALKYWDGSAWQTLPGIPGPAGGQAVIQAIGDGVNTAFAVAHGMGTRNVQVAVFRNSAPFDEVVVDVERTDTNTVTVRTAPVVPAANELVVVVSAPGQQATLALAMDGWHTVGNPGEPAFENGWVNFGGGLSTAGFRKTPDGRVWLRGQVKSGTNGTTIFTLPAGYRPPARVDFDQIDNTGNPSFALTTGGAIIHNSAVGNVRVTLDGLSFDTEAVTQVAAVGVQPMDQWHLVGNPGEPAFQNSWVNYGAPYLGARFRKYPDGRVRLAGVVRGGAVNTVVFTLPVGYRPPGSTGVMPLLFNASGGPAECDIAPDGTIKLYNIGASAPGTAAYFDGIEFDTETVANYSAGLIGPPLVTALPANPFDGQECYFLADAANGVIWHLRYRAASASAYKWEVVGGDALYAFNDASGNKTGTGYADLNTGAGPSLVPPLSGEYDVTLMSINNADFAGTASYDALVQVSGTVIGNASGYVQHTVNSPAYAPIVRRATVTLTGGLTYKMQHQSSTVNAIYAANRRIELLPRRVG